MYMFYNGPAANNFNSGRFSYYGVTGTPTAKFDGGAASASAGSYPATIANRLAKPCYLDIEVTATGSFSTGTLSYSITAEQDLGVSGQIKIWSVITEDHDMAAGGWGYYSGMEMMWLPMAWPLGTQGDVITFTGPYPQTVDLSAPYTLNPAIHTFDNLHVVTFVQVTSTKQVLNANYMHLADATGIEGQGVVDPGVGDLSVWPNPSSGSLTVSTLVPDGASGTITVFSISGRTVDSFDASPATELNISEPGIYFAILETSAGDTFTESFTILD